MRLQFLVFLGLGSIRGMAEQNAKKRQKNVHAIMTGRACCCVVSPAFSVCAHADVDLCCDVDFCCVVVQIRENPNACVSVWSFLCFGVLAVFVV